jgi:hypothetical protein
VIFRRIALAAALAVPALLTASPAGAASLPVVYGSNDGWLRGSVRPADIWVGNGGAPWVSGLRWEDWTGRTAYGRGVLHEMADPWCTPVYACAYVRYRAGVWLHEVKTHDGVRYFAQMSFSWNAGGQHHVLRMHVRRGFFWYGA